MKTATIKILRDGDPRKDRVIKTATIGIMRDDGDLAIFATLNNNDEHMTDESFAQLMQHVSAALSDATEGPVYIMPNGTDAIDYVEVPQ